MYCDIIGCLKMKKSRIFKTSNKCGGTGGICCNSEDIYIYIYICMYHIICSDVSFHMHAVTYIMHINYIQICIIYEHIHKFKRILNRRKIMQIIYK